MHFYHHFEDKDNIYILLEYCSRRVSRQFSYGLNIKVELPVCFIVRMYQVMISVYVYTVAGPYTEGTESPNGSRGEVLPETDGVCFKIPSRSRDSAPRLETRYA